MRLQFVRFSFLTALLLAVFAPFDCSAIAKNVRLDLSAGKQKHFYNFFQPDIEDKGDFKVGFAPAKGKKQKSKLDASERKVLQGLADEMNGVLALPVDVYLTLAECGEPNAFYEPERRQLTMCYELYAQLDEIFKEDFPKEAERDEAVAGAFVFVLFHEIGHALVDVYELPITGKEEDAVDQLSTWLLTDGTDDGEMMAINGAIAFALLGDGEESDFAFWDEHSLNQQRFYNTICLVYGQNPEKYGEFVKNKTLPKNRAERCSAEYAQIDRAWSKLLAPYVKN